MLENKNIRVPLIGLFNVYNVLAATALARALEVSLDTIQTSLEDLPVIAGRVEKFESPKNAEKSMTENFCITGHHGNHRSPW